MPEVMVSTGSFYERGLHAIVDDLGEDGAIAALDYKSGLI